MDIASKVRFHHKLNHFVCILTRIVNCEISPIDKSADIGIECRVDGSKKYLKAD